MTFYENVLDAAPELVRRGVVDRQRLHRAETEDFLRAMSEAYPARRGAYWSPDYSSVEAFVAHALEKEVARFADADSEEEIKKRLKGLGYIS